MNAPLRHPLLAGDPLDALAIALAQALARQHHADSQRAPSPAAGDGTAASLA